MRPNHICNYAVLRFLPYPETGEFVNVGVVVNCQEPCLFRFFVEETTPARLKALFPNQDTQAFEAGAAAMHQELARVKTMIRDPKTCQSAFHEAIRPRESTFRFSEARTILSDDPEGLAEALFKRYVRMEALPQGEPQMALA